MESRALNKYTNRSKQETSQQFCSRVLGGIMPKRDLTIRWGQRMNLKAKSFWLR